MQGRASRTWIAALVACTFAGACRGSSTPRDETAAPALDAVGDFALDATVGGGMHFEGIADARIRLIDDGSGSVSFRYDLPNGSHDETVRATQPLALERTDVADLRARIERSGFFGSWPYDGRRVTDQDTWIVSVRSGGREKALRVYAQEQFDETAQFLWRAIHQGVAEYALAAGRTDVLADLFKYDGNADRVLHVEPVVAALRESALHGATLAVRGGAVVALRSLVSSDDFVSLLRASLDGADDARRQAILAPLVDRGAIAAPLRDPEIVLPYALSELERSWRDWDCPDALRAQFLRDCASALVWCHEVRAVPVFERMVVELSTVERPLVLAPLAAMGDAAIDSLARLAADDRSELRLAAARMSEGLACELVSHSACARPPGAEPSAALAPFRERLVPRLERLADDASGDERTRRAASEALAAIGDRAAPPGWKWHRLDWN